MANIAIYYLPLLRCSSKWGPKTSSPSAIGRVVNKQTPGPSPKNPQRLRTLHVSHPGILKQLKFTDHCQVVCCHSAPPPTQSSGPLGLWEALLTFLSMLPNVSFVCVKEEIDK